MRAKQLGTVAASILVAFTMPALAHNKHHTSSLHHNTSHSRAAMNGSTSNQRTASNAGDTAVQRSPEIYQQGATSGSFATSDPKKLGSHGGVSDGGSASENGSGEPGR